MRTGISTMFMPSQMGKELKGFYLDADGHVFAIPCGGKGVTLMRTGMSTMSLPSQTGKGLKEFYLDEDGHIDNVFAIPDGERVEQLKTIARRRDVNVVSSTRRHWGLFAYKWKAI